MKMHERTHHACSQVLVLVWWDVVGHFDVHRGGRESENECSILGIGLTVIYGGRRRSSHG